MALLLASMLALAFNVQPVKGGTITVPDDYPTIQGAINAAFENDTVFVRNGTYYENIVVDKTASLVGENAQNTVIDGGGSGNVVNVTVNGVNVSGFTIRNSTINTAGIILVNSSHCNIVGNNITNNDIGVALGYSSNNTVLGNTIINNGMGVHLGYSSNNTVSENNITANNGHGVRLSASSNNTVSENNITANNGDGVSLHSCSNNISGNNITNNRGGVSFDYSSNSTVFGNNITANKFDGANFFQSSNCTVFGNNITANSENGVYLSFSSNNNVSGNNITNNTYGVYLDYSSYNTISSNNITNNGNGVFPSESSNNRFFHNNFIDNTQQVNITWYSGADIWDSGYPNGGNYWSNYTDVDLHSGPFQNETGADGIWDHPYVIDANNQDNYPIVPEFPTVMILPLFMAISLLGLVLVKKRARRKTV